MFHFTASGNKWTQFRSARCKHPLRLIYFLILLCVWGCPWSLLPGASVAFWVCWTATVHSLMKEFSLCPVSLCDDILFKCLLHLSIKKVLSYEMMSTQFYLKFGKTEFRRFFQQFYWMCNFYTWNIEKTVWADLMG